MLRQPDPEEPKLSQMSASPWYRRSKHMFG